ncbi:MAG: MBL fold metallo-hydrolase [Bacteroidales bacterium]|nr:MBL fold metallo-hydrolase [Bacteroidales bacterium]
MLHVQVFTCNMVEENTYIIHDTATREAAIIDCGALYPHEQKNLLDYIQEHELRIVHLLNTHGHFDHVFGLQWASETFGVRPMLHQAEETLYLAAEEGLKLFFPHPFPLPVPPIGKLLQEGDSIPLGEHNLKVLFTPGHTPGGVCFYDEQAAVLLAGDSLFQENIGRCDLPGGNLSTLLQSLRDKLLPLPDAVVVYPGHGPSTTIGHERKYNPYLQ